MDLKELAWVVVCCVNRRIGTMKGCCVHGDELIGSIKCGKFFD
jgi:hypothetical protein